MNSMLHVNGSLLACSLFFGAWSAESAAPFTYNFAPGRTNAYKIEVESQSDAGPEAMTGVFMFWTTTNNARFFTISYKGQFQNRPDPRRGPMMYRPGGITLYQLLGMNYGGPFPGKELVVDSRGMIVRVSGDTPLPLPMGTLFSALFPELPAETSAKWESSKTSFVEDEPLLLGPAASRTTSPYGGYMPAYRPGSGGPAMVAVNYTTKAELKDDSSISSTINLNSYMMTGEEPRISSSAEATWALDMEAKLPKSVQWNCKTLVTTEHATRRISLSLKAEKLEGQALAEAITPPPPVSPEQLKLSGEQAAALISKMQSKDDSGRMSAANELSQKTVTDIDQASLDKLVTLASDPESWVRRAAVKVLSAHARPGDLPVLVRAAADEDSGSKQEIIKGIARIKTSKAASALAELMAQGTGDFYGGRPSEVATALIGMGPLAEPAVLPLLGEKNSRTLIDACSVLRETGTKRSVSPLKQLVVHPSKNVSEAAAAALRAIEGRRD